MKGKLLKRQMLALIKRKETPCTVIGKVARACNLRYGLVGSQGCLTGAK